MILFVHYLAINIIIIQGDIMEIVIIAAIVIGVVGWWIWKEGKHEEAGHPLESLTKKLDVNKDGKVDLADAKAVVVEVKETVAVAADVNKDGKVDVEDAKVVVKEVKAKTKQAATKAKAKVAAVKEKATKPRKPKK